MEKKIHEYLADIKSFSPKTQNDIDAFRIKYLGKKGLVGGLFGILKTASIEEKKRMGQLINQLKQAISSKIENAKKQMNPSPTNENSLDLTRPGYPFEIGNRHPISILKNKIVNIFGSVGFSLSEGPEIEDDWHNFTALNLPHHHPARDMQDTFFVQKSPDYLLRTHTSSVQVRYMTSQSPPIRTISPGRVFRNEVISARSHCLFHQVEGLVIDKDISFADLKQMISFFVKSFFGKSKMRFRPSYFPFTEPSAEVDIYWGLNTESDYRITKGTGWLEILGCGMVHPNVLKNCGIDPELHSGYAFGMGLERMAMLLYNITDIRSFYENDIRFLSQFRTELV